MTLLLFLSSFIYYVLGLLMIMIHPPLNMHATLFLMGQRPWTAVFLMWTLWPWNLVVTTINWARGHRG